METPQIQPMPSQPHSKNLIVHILLFIIAFLLGGIATYAVLTNMTSISTDTDMTQNVEQAATPDSNAVTSPTASTPPQNTTSEQRTTYTNVEKGLTFTYPAWLYPSQKGEMYGFILSLSLQSPALNGPASVDSMKFFVNDAAGARDFLEYQTKKPFVDGDSEQVIKFTPRNFNGITWYFARTERFEGVLIFDYYTVHDNKLYRAQSISRGLDFSNPNFTEENDVVHVMLKDLLSTFNFVY